MTYLRPLWFQERTKRIAKSQFSWTLTRGIIQNHEMALRKWAYLYLSPGFSPEKNTAVSSSDQCEFIAVGFDFSAKEDSLKIAQKLVADGVQMIELCGGFGPLWIAKISDAIGGAVPVGSTAYGPEARRPMLDILS